MHETATGRPSDGATPTHAHLALGALDTELAGIDLGDARLNRRAQQVLGQVGAKPSVSIPAACGGWD
uniref:IS4/Tn5 family transposase DNA-binding protein n=1 Tax=uncultured Thiocystis sp. TaxID=1202134 RepID=UPI0025E68118